MKSKTGTLPYPPRVAELFSQASQEEHKRLNLHPGKEQIRGTGLFSLHLGRTGYLLSVTRSRDLKPSGNPVGFTLIELLILLLIIGILVAIAIPHYTAFIKKIRELWYWQCTRSPSTSSGIDLEIDPLRH